MVIVVTPPTSPNGVILQYIIERRDSNLTTTIVGMLLGTDTPLALGDTSTQPFTSYSYRVLAETSAGTTASAYTTFLTPEAGMLPNMYHLICSHRERNVLDEWIP